MNPELKLQLRAALSRAIAVPNTLSPVTCESIADYLVTGTIDKTWLCRNFGGGRIDLCSLVDAVLDYLCFGLYNSMECALTRLNAALDHYYNEP